MSSIYARNLRALELVDARTAACLSNLALKKGQLASDLAPKDQATKLHYAEGDLLFLQGSGHGHEVALALANENLQVRVLECDVSALASVLSVVDVSEALLSGRIVWHFLTCGSAVTQEISIRECLSTLVYKCRHLQGSIHWLSTTTTADHSEVYRSLQEGLEYAALRESCFSRAKAPIQDFDVTVISPCCAIFDDLALCFSRLGLKTQLLRVPDRSGVWSKEQRQEALLGLVNHPSALVMTRNRSLFETEYPLEASQPEAYLPGQVAFWWWDVPNLATHCDLLFPYGQAQSMAFARDLLTLLPQGSTWLPPGARSPFVEAGLMPLQQPTIPVSFVGQSRLGALHANLQFLGTTLQALGGSSRYLGKELKGFNSYLKIYEYLSRHQHEIGTSIDNRVIRYPAHAYYLHYLLAMVVTGAFRIAAIERLIKEGVAIQLWGDEEWLQVPGVTHTHYQGVLHPDQLPTLYRQSQINLNLNFMQVSSTVNPKVLDIAATGGVVLTDERPELQQLYPEPSVRPFVFSGLDQLTERVESLLSMDLTAHQNSLRAYTHQHHTLQQRAAWLAHHFGLR